jgi:hypothetical protein
MAAAILALGIFNGSAQGQLGGSTTFNNANVAQWAGTTSVSDSANMSVTAGATDLCAFAVIGYDGASSPAITGVTWNGVAMTLAGSPGVAQTIAPYTGNSVIYYLANPATGTHTLAITGNSNVFEIYYNLVSFNHCNQSSPVRSGTYANTYSTTAGSASGSIVISSNASDLTISTTESGQYVGTDSTNQTSDGINNSGGNGFGSDHATTPAASVTSTWTADHNFNASSLCGLSVRNDSSVVIVAPAAKWFAGLNRQAIGGVR